MVILYKKTEDNLYYWKTWQKDKKTSIIYTGKVGELGQVKRVKTRFLFFKNKKNITTEMNLKLSEGYDKIGKYHIKNIIINLKEITTLDIFKEKKKLEERLYETLYLNGIGHSGYAHLKDNLFEVNCYVIDSLLAEQVIKQSFGKTFLSHSKTIDERQINIPIKLKVSNLFLKMNLKSNSLN